MNSLPRVQFLARHYESLQGLKAVPFAAIALLFGLNLLIAGGPAPVPALGVLFLLMALLAAPVAHFGLRGYYRRNFGYAQTRFTVSEGLYTALFVIGLTLDQQFRLPVSVFALSVGVYFIDQWRPTRELRPHYLGLGLLMLAYGLAAGLVPAPLRLAVASISIGLVTLLGGLYDHFLLVRLTSAPRPEAPDDHAL